MVWVNIDIPLKSCMIHIDNCIYVSNMKSSPNKGINLLKRDGGWISFNTTEEANQFCLDQYTAYKRVVHC